MTMTDPIADMLTRLRNANQAYHDSTSMPHSKIKVGIAEILQQQGYITGFEVLEPAEGEVAKTLRVTLKYAPDRSEVIAGLKRVSRPGLRRYVGAQEIPVIFGGMGTVIMSTPQGIMTGRKARKQNVGGEVLAYVW